MSNDSKMREIEERYKVASGLTNRKFYKVYYSHIHPFPILVLGLNPGGVPDSTYLAASDSFYENWEHDYVKFWQNSQYTMARPTMDFLSAALDTNSANTLRQIPATNIIFRRSQSSDKLSQSVSKSFAETRPYLQELIEIVRPELILFISKTAYSHFTRKLCIAVREEKEHEIKTPNGRSFSTLFLAATCYLPCLSRKVRLVTTGHPSKYAGRSEWPRALQAFQKELKKLNLCPLDSHKAIQRLESLPDHRDMPRKFGSNK
jgi:hypothetical protein